ncbi:hypothetical protein ACMU6081_09850 [Achromobacter mucicolens]
MQAQHRALFIGAFEQLVFDAVHRPAHQRQHIRTHVAGLAGQIQHAHGAAFAVRDGHGRAGQDAIGFEIVFGAMHGNGTAFDERGADGVGAGGGLVPGRARHQGHARGAMRKARVAVRVQHQALRVRQDDQVAAAARLVAQISDGGFGHAAQRFVSLLRFAQFALRHEFGAAHAAHVKAQVGAAAPGTQDRFGNHAARHRALLVKKQPCLRQRLPTGVRGHVCLLGAAFCDACAATPVSRQRRRLRH